MDTPGLNTIWIEKFTYNPQSSIMQHVHVFFHYIYVVSGSGTITLDNNTFPLTPGKIYLASPNTSHGFCASDDAPLIVFELKFSLSGGTLHDSLCKLPLLYVPTNNDIYNILEEMHDETDGQFPYYSDIVNAKLHLFLLKLLRESTASGDGYPTSDRKYGAEKAFTPAINYITDHLHEEITLEQLADVMRFEKTYFSKKFKRATGKAPMDFIRDARLAKAKNLLLFSDMSITQIADVVGYQTIHYFTATFKKHFGVPPHRFRIENRP